MASSIVAPSGNVRMASRARSFSVAAGIGKSSIVPTAWLSLGQPNARLQPRRHQMLARAAVGCKPMLGSMPLARTLCRHEPHCENSTGYGVRENTCGELDGQPRPKSEEAREGLIGLSEEQPD